MQKLPLNRDEKYYTATIFPVLFSDRNYEYLGQFLSLAGYKLDITEQTEIKILTEYSLSKNFDDNKLPKHLRVTPD